MTQPITSPPPVNSLITIQPITTAAPERDSSGTPNAFSNLAAGTTVEGFVVNRDGTGNPILRTTLGDVLVQSDVFLKTGSEVVIRVDPSVATRARIVTVDGQTPEDYSAATATRGLQRDTITPSTLQINTAASALTTLLNASGLPGALPLLQARVLQATNPNSKPSAQSAGAGLLPPNIRGDVVPPAFAQLPAGTPLQLTVLDVELPPVPVALASLPDVELPATLLPPAPKPPAAAAPAAPLGAPVAGEALPAAPGTAVAPSANSAASVPPNAAPVTLPANAPAPLSASEALLSAQQVPARTAQTANAFAPSTTQSTSPLNQSANYPINPQALAVPPTAASNVSITRTVPAASPAFTPATPAPATAANSTNPAASVASSPNTRIIHAHVLGHEADGANIVQTKFATLKIYSAQPLPTGTNLTLQAELLPQASITPESLGKNADALTSLTRDWHHLGDALNELQAADPAAARAALANIPTVGPRFASSVLFFLAAIKGGEVRELLGTRGASKLASLAPELLARLTQDVGQMQQFYVDSPMNQWSGVMLPMVFGQELQQARLYVRRDGAEEKSVAPISERGQRFILEVDMSQLGDMQFDGFVRGSTAKAFDLIIRTSRPLPEEVNAQIRALFTNAAAVTGLNGQLAFQQGAEHFVRPLASDMKPNSGSDTHTILA